MKFVRLWDKFVAGFDWVYRFFAPKIVAALLALMLAAAIIGGLVAAIGHFSVGEIWAGLLFLFVALVSILFARMWPEEISALWRCGPAVSKPRLPKIPPMPKVSPPPKASRPDYIPPSQTAVQTTRYIEKDLGHCSYAWVCEQCDDARCFDYPLPEDIDFNFCPKCGRRIMEFVPYKDPLEDWVDE